MATFFKHQNRARKSTTFLLFLYILSVITIIIGTYFFILWLFTLTNNNTSFYSQPLWHPEMFKHISASLILLVGGGTMYKSLQLSKGGSTVAEMLGGRLVNQSSTGLNERRLLNIVQEIAIASGTKVPPIYILDREKGINAFAAGFKTGQAVIAVSRGCSELLTRDELQGVIAHEFSHIINGDMRLNIRLMCILHGILVIALTGYTLVRLSSRTSQYSSSNSKRNGGGGIFLILGAGLMILGYTGVFFSNLIKMAVSRQREFLADASAVQFTRNPSGIGGALKKIGSITLGSRISHPRAEEASHMFFARGIKSKLIQLLSTHPPLDKRIKKIDPSFDGIFVYKSIAEISKNVFEETKEKYGNNDEDKGDFATSILKPEKIVDKIGTFDPESLTTAKGILFTIPLFLLSSAQNPYSAQALIFCLLLSPEKENRRKQLEIIKNTKIKGIEEEVIQTEKITKSLEKKHRLPLVDLALASLLQMSKSQYFVFRKAVDDLIHADDHMNVFEYTLHCIVLRHLDPKFGKENPIALEKTSLKSLVKPVNNLLLALAILGNDSTEDAKKAYEAGAEHCGIDKNLRAEFNTDLDISTNFLDNSLKKIINISPDIKEKILLACVACITIDKTITVNEFELIRAISDSLDCPLPPLSNI